VDYFSGQERRKEAKKGVGFNVSYTIGQTNENFYFQFQGIWAGVTSTAGIVKSIKADKIVFVFMKMLFAPTHLALEGSATLPFLNYLFVYASVGSVSCMILISLTHIATTSKRVFRSSFPFATPQKDLKDIPAFAEFDVRRQRQLFHCLQTGSKDDNLSSYTMPTYCAFISKPVMLF
jgi:hypothetical protein